MKSLLPTALIVVLTGCGDVMFLEGSVNQLCQKLPAQSFRAPPVPGSVQLPPTVTIERRFDFDITAQLPTQLDRAQLTIGLDRMAITAPKGVDLGFVMAANVTLEPPEGTSLPHVVVKKDEGSTTSQLLFEGQDLELAPYLESGVLSYTVALTASTTSMPTNVSADVDACANVALHWDYAR